MISNFPVLADACVLVQAAVRDTLLRLSERGLFLVRWSEDIIDEVVRTLRNKIGRSAEDTDYLVAELRNYFPEAWIEIGYRQLIPAMTIVEKDRHVLAAAVAGGCEVIITYNVKDFPPNSLAPLNVRVMAPDEFLIEVYQVSSEDVIHELRQQGAVLRVRKNLSQVLHSLEICRCNKFAQLIREELSL